MTATELTGEALVAAHKQAIRRVRLLSIAFPIAFIALLLTYLSSFADQIRGVSGAAVGAELSSRVNDIMPEINESLGELADAAQPALTHAIETESLAMAPKIEEQLRTEVDRTVDGARRDLTVAAQKSIAATADAHRALLIKEFPQLASDTAAQDKVLAATSSAIVRWQDRQLDATLAEHLSAMDQLRSTLETSFTKPQTQEAHPEDALMTWLDLLNKHIGGEDPILASSDKARKPAAMAGDK
jgi:hypothetical protein